MIKRLLYTTLLFTCIAAVANAADNAVRVPGKHMPKVQKEDQQQTRELPPEAYKDCAGKREGMTVQIKLSSGEKITATCTAHGKRLYARPNTLPRLEQGGRSNAK